MGRFSPVESSAGVAKPPTRPRSAMNIESRRIESRTATAVTSTMRPNAATGMIRSQRTRAAKKVEKMEKVEAENCEKEKNVEEVNVLIVQ